MAKLVRLKRFLAKVKALFTRVDDLILKHIDVAINITTKLKEALNSPVAILITDLFPGKIDDMLREKATVALSATIDAMNIVKECQDKPTISEKIQCYLEHVKQFPPLMQHAVLAKLASTISREMGNNDHSEHLYDLWVQQKYSVEK